MNPRLFFWVLTSALAGFLFGFDTVVISGAEQTLEELWQLSPQLHGLAVGIALWGTVLGAMVGGWPTDYWGRKKTLLSIGLLYFVSALWSAASTDVYAFMIARFIGGVGVGISTVAAPLYISEIAPPAWRGRLAGMFQFNIVFGILVAFCSNYLLEGMGENAWRWMLGVEAVPALIYTLLCLGIPESPRWLITVRGDRESGIEVLRAIQPTAEQQELDSLLTSILDAAEKEHDVERIWQPKYHRLIWLAVLIAFFNQLSGINAILYFAPRIFELTGLGERSALLQSVGIGLTNLVFTFVGLWLIDRVGRRTLLTIGSLGYILSLGLCSWAFFAEQYSIVPACIFGFIAAHAVGQGAVIWVFLSEIFPNRIRAAGQSLGSSTHWIFAALLTTVFPTLVKYLHPGVIFMVFCSLMVLQFVWVRRVVLETKGLPLELIQQELGIS